MGQFTPLVRAISGVFSRLEARGCAGLVVVVPVDNAINHLTKEVGRHECFSYPHNFNFDRREFIAENPAMVAAKKFLTTPSTAVGCGLNSITGQASGVMATTLPMVGNSFHTTAYFCFANSIADELLMRGVVYESNAIWRGLRESLLLGISELNIEVDADLLHILHMSQAGRTSKEIAEKLNISFRIVEKRLEKLQVRLNASNKLDAMQKAQLMGII